MYYPEEFKLNKFVEVRIPSNREYFSRLGFVSPDNLPYIGDELISPVMSKIDAISHANNDYLDYVRASE